jgi:pimeloyl-ACP methyl ester carboxylesterase
VSDVVERGRGEGPRVVLVHGASGEPEAAWPAQLDLDSRYHLVLTRSADPDEVVEALGTRAHVVAFGDDGEGALLAAQRAPQLVRSLCLVEPPLAALSPGVPADQVPVLVVTGGWNEELEGVAAALVERAKAEHVVLPRYGRRPQDAGHPFNDRLEQLWADAAARER